MAHDHAHIDPESGDRRVSLAIWANALLTVAQIVGGIFAGSLALIADALHNFSDMASLVIAFVARKIARRPADARMTFGYGRIEIVAALINYTTLILVGIYLIYEGGMRMIDPPAVAGWTVLAFALSYLLQAGTLLLTRRGPLHAVAGPLAIGAGNRNIALFLVALPPEALAPLMIFIGCWQLPMYLTPVLLPRLYERMLSND